MISLILNIVCSAAVFSVVNGLLVWSIATQDRDLASDLTRAPRHPEKATSRAARATPAALALPTD